jgi:hypothetical protein
MSPQLGRRRARLISVDCDNRLIITTAGPVNASIDIARLAEHYGGGIESG